LHWPYFITTLIFTESAIWNVFIYLDIAGDLRDITYYEYWPYLIQPIIFLVTVHALTPNKHDKNTAAYFSDRISVIFGLMAVYIGCHFLQGFEGLESLGISRIIGIAMCIIIAVTKKVSLVYVLGAIWVVSLFFR
jgi:hypothetical protein